LNGLRQTELSSFKKDFSFKKIIESVAAASPETKKIAFFEHPEET